ncbi:hypothetical protein [Rhodobium gokarnense]|uniref:ABC transporter permease n=1 Tax=Rhodobium gokarnense TaxID=364296 RepID=A0ABT3HCY9_9HYPH|nr:hypothetical protein [Rhodobium gokarnense]MCW2308256.1 hypothetical protein [Rhodobium gokarnense]
MFKKSIWILKQRSIAIVTAILGILAWSFICRQVNAVILRDLGREIIGIIVLFIVVRHLQPERAQSGTALRRLPTFLIKAVLVVVMTGLAQMLMAVTVARASLAGLLGDTPNGLAFLAVVGALAALIMAVVFGVFGPWLVEAALGPRSGIAASTRAGLATLRYTFPRLLIPCAMFWLLNIVAMRVQDVIQPLLSMPSGSVAQNGAALALGAFVVVFRIYAWVLLAVVVSDAYRRGMQASSAEGERVTA